MMAIEATVDFPCYPWYKEHMKQYPDAKVILTVRPFEEDGMHSFYSTIWQAQNPSGITKDRNGTKSSFRSSSSICNESYGIRETNNYMKIIFREDF